MGVALIGGFLGMDSLSVSSVFGAVDGALKVTGNASILVENVAELSRMELVNFCHDLVGIFEIASATAVLNFHLVRCVLIALGS